MGVCASGRNLIAQLELLHFDYHIIITMRHFYAATVIALISGVLISAEAVAQRRFNSTRKRHKPEMEIPVEPVVHYDTLMAPDRGNVSITGFDKALHSGKESFFIVNNTGFDIKAVDLTMVYSDMSGNQLHTVTAEVSCDVPSGESRHIARASWDRQRSFYYHRNPPYRPRTVATPFDVSATVNYALVVPRGAAMPKIIPLPQSMKLTGGAPFEATADMYIYIPDKKFADSFAPRLATTALNRFKIKKGRKPGKAGAAVTFTLDRSVKHPEGYELSIAASGVEIKASTADGMYYGAVTLGELISESDTIAALVISDEPRLPYRGMMIDVSRHFHGFDFLKRQIDVMARLKLNNLHLHLTDAAGWRMEIEKYPRLTELAAWRPDSTWDEWTANGAGYCSASDPRAYGGYFTKAQLRELVEYAALRGINIIPEIEMPGHSAEVVKVYPELSCTRDSATAEDFCPGSELTFRFIEDVLDEVMDVFPSQMIHIGGDEAAKKAWHDCPLCRQRMRDENLSDVNELQSYLVERVERFLNSRGRSLLGWDEIMEGGLAPNATVMSWRGIEGGLRAASQGHKAIMTPGGYCYLDSYQDAPFTQPKAFGGYLPLEKVYSYDPVPDTLDDAVKNMICGVQGNLWCEKIPTDSHAEFMLYPRMIAIAEVGWTPQQRREWNNFYVRALNFNDGLRARGYNAFDISKEYGNRPEALEKIRHLAVGSKVSYAMPWHKSYSAGGASALVDGIRGGWNYSDMLWQGFEQRDTDERIDVIIDLGYSRDIAYIGADFMQITIPDVWLPSRVEIYAGDNTDSMQLLTVIDNEVVDDGGEVSFKNFGWKGSTKARFVRYRALTPRGFLFTDEIVVK